MGTLTRKRREDEVKYCNHCNNLMKRKRYSSGVLESNLHFSRRKYCDRECMKKSYVMRVDTASTESNSRMNARLRMEYFIGHDCCQKCGEEDSLDVHHIDENPYNNDLENLILLCRSCHMKVHRPKSLCSICDSPHKGLGYCDKHYQRFKKYGNPYMTKYGKRD